MKLRIPKKITGTLIAVAIPVLNVEHSLGYSEDTIWMTIIPIMVYVLGQGIADAGWYVHSGRKR